MARTSSCARTLGDLCLSIQGQPSAPAVAPPLPSRAGVIPAATSAPAIDNRTTFALTVTAPYDDAFRAVEELDRTARTSTRLRSSPAAGSPKSGLIARRGPVTEVGESERAVV